MRLSTLSVRVEHDDRVEARYSPARTDRLADGYELNVRALVHGPAGPAAAVVRMDGGGER